MNGKEVLQKAPEAMRAFADIVEIIEKLGVALSKFAEALTKEESVPAAITVEAKEIPEKVKEADAGAETGKAEPVSVEKVREVLLSKDRAAVKKLLTEMGAVKLSAVPEEKLSELYQAALQLKDKEA